MASVPMWEIQWCSWLQLSLALAAVDFGGMNQQIRFSLSLYFSDIQISYKNTKQNTTCLFSTIKYAAVS